MLKSVHNLRIADRERPEIEKQAKGHGITLSFLFRHSNRHEQWVFRDAKTETVLLCYHPETGAWRSGGKAGVGLSCQQALDLAVKVQHG